MPNNAAASLADISTNMLVSMASKMKLQAEAMQAELKRLTDEIAKRFEGKKASEQIITEDGVATRKAGSTWEVVTGKVDELREKLGAEFDSYIDTTTTVELAESKVASLRQFLGDRFPEFFIETTTYKPTAAFRSDYRKQDGKLRRYVRGLVRVTDNEPKITIEPVRRNQ
jgi:hypothetical protein